MGQPWLQDNLTSCPCPLAGGKPFQRLLQGIPPEACWLLRLWPLAVTEAGHSSGRLSPGTSTLLRTEPVLR